MIRVVKLGGSLLSLPDVAERLQRWLHEQVPAANLLLVGGGPTVDRLRERHRRGQLTDEDAHWLAVAAMRDHAQTLLASETLRGVWLNRLEDLPRSHDGLFALDPVVFLREVDPDLSGGKLPSRWDVTSDSIAARVAEAVAADQLVLLKSTLPRPGGTLDDWAREGLVDAWFPRLAHERQVLCVDLRTGACAEYSPHLRKYF